jgi:uncharacterized membrane protein
MRTVYSNQHGRRPTRGIRPWLLIPKVMCVALFLGSLAAANFIWFTSRWTELDAADGHRLWTVNLIGSMMRFLTVPALLLAIGFGFALLLQHPRTFLRLRWLQLKLACVLVAIPASHFFLSSRLALLRAAAETAHDDRAAAVQFGCGLAISCIAFAGIVVLARLKPRLAQNWARAFPGNSTSSKLRSDQNVVDDVPADVR